MSVLTGLLLAAPWVLLFVLTPFLLWRRVQLSSNTPVPVEEAPLVSVIVPARNEAENISVCLASIMNTLYPRYEIIVVDDASIDGTGEIVRILADHTDSRLQLVHGEALPDGWMGKSWACWQGYQRARGDILLFTDADTRHDDMLLSHAVGALVRQNADLVSVMPRQLMVGFAERLIQPHIFAMLLARYHDLDDVNRTREPRDVIANGQFLLIRREAYNAFGGHEALRAEVVEDQRMAQRLVSAGKRIYIAHAHDLMETRMYRSFRGIVEGWSKNLALGSKQASHGWLAPIVPWFMVLFLLLFWVAPPATLIASIFTAVPSGIQAWSVAATAVSLLTWLYVHAWMGIPLHNAPGYPIGGVFTAWIALRSILRGRRVEWRGRSYIVDPAGPAAPARRP